MLNKWLLDQAMDVLDGIYITGVTRMISTPQWLMNEFKINKQTANKVLWLWIQRQKLKKE